MDELVRATAYVVVIMLSYVLHSPEMSLHSTYAEVLLTWAFVLAGL